MYYDRGFEIKPAMFLRWILFNENPSARRNIQYLFSAIHNKDMRAVDSGTFAAISSTSNNKYTAKDIIDKANLNDRELENDHERCEKF
jgi:hypothetical protein